MVMQKKQATCVSKKSKLISDEWNAFLCVSFCLLQTLSRIAWFYFHFISILHRPNHSPAANKFRNVANVTIGEPNQKYHFIVFISFVCELAEMTVENEMLCVQNVHERSLCQTIDMTFDDIDKSQREIHLNRSTLGEWAWGEKSFFLLIFNGNYNINAMNRVPQKNWKKEGNYWCAVHVCGFRLFMSFIFELHSKYLWITSYLMNLLILCFLEKCFLLLLLLPLLLLLLCVELIVRSAAHDISVQCRCDCMWQNRIWNVRKFEPN